MGFFDKLKNFFGGHGVSVVLTELEGASPDAAQLPLTDSVLKGRIEVHSKRSVEILKHGFRLTAILRDGEEYRTAMIAEEFNEGEITGSDVSWPYTTNPDEVVQDSFCIIRIDIPSAMEKLGLEPDAAINDERVSIELQVWADVAGTLLDASTKITLPIVEAGQARTSAEPQPAEPQQAAPREPQEIPVRTQELPLEPAPYLERFNAMVEELRANPKIEVLEYTVNPPATDAELAQAEEYAAVPEAMKQFYRQCNGLKLEWALASAGDDRSPHGNISIMKVQQTFSSWKGVIWFDEEWDDGRHKPLHPLDFFVPEACAALFLDGSDTPKVYYHYCGEQMDSLEVDFEGYLELLLKSRGYWYWQKAIVTDLTGQEYTVEPREFRLGMPELFDDYDPTFFLRKDYSESDAAYMAERRQKGEKLREVLNDANVEYQVKGNQGLAVDLLDTPENLDKFATALKTLSPHTNLTSDWGMMQIGEYQFSRTEALN